MIKGPSFIVVGTLLKPKYEGKQNGSINWIIRHVIQQIRASEKAQLMPRYNIDKFSSKINIEIQRRRKLKLNITRSNQAQD